MALAYLSNGWIDAARERILAVKDLPSFVDGVSVAILMVVTDRPGLDGEAIYIQFKDGALEEVSAGSRQEMEASHDSVDFTILASYDTFAKIHRDELDERAAVLSGKIGVKGSVMKALRLMGTVRKLNTLLREVEADYTAEAPA